MAGLQFVSRGIHCMFVLNAWTAMYCIFGCEQVTVTGEQWRDLLISPKRASLA